MTASRRLPMHDLRTDLEGVVRAHHTTLETMLLMLETARGPEAANASLGLRHFLAAHEAAEARALLAPATGLSHHVDAAVTALASEDTVPVDADEAVAELGRAIAEHAESVENEVLPAFLAGADDHGVSVALSTMRDVESVARAQRTDNEGPAYSDLLAAAVARFDKRAELR